MSIEADLGRIATSLEALVDLLKTSTSAAAVAAADEKPAEKPKATTRKPAKPAPEPEEQAEEQEDDLGLDDEPEEKAETYTVDDVRKALKNYRDINGGPATMQVLKDHGASGMGDLKPEKFASVMKAVR